MFTILKNVGNEETVYNMVERQTVSAPPPPRYRSRYSCFVRQEVGCNKTGCYRTMGLPTYHQCPPENYLRKQSKVPISVLPCGVSPWPSCEPPPPQMMVCQTVQTQPEQSEKEAQGGGRGDGEDDSRTQDATCGSEPQQPQESVVCASVKCRVPRICCNAEKPPVPLSCCGFGLIPRGCKDFVWDNALKVVRAPAKIPAARSVDMPNGHTFDWCTSGYPRKYVCKGDYGMIPGYLVERNRELIEAEKAIKCTMEARDADAAAACRHMSEEERTQLICGLKAHWAETFREFQGLPLKIDTQGKIKRKGELEEELKGLEKDIQMLERHNHIFLAKTNKSFYMA